LPQTLLALRQKPFATWYKPEKIVDTVKGIEEGLKKEGLTDEEARLRALNEAARTSEGERAISEAIGED